MLAQVQVTLSYLAASSLTTCYFLRIMFHNLYSLNEICSAINTTIYIYSQQHKTNPDDLSHTDES